MWQSILDSGGPEEVPPAVLHNLKVYYGGRGIWADKARTHGLTENGVGVTVGLLHTGKTYADDLSPDAVTYHYPTTKQPGRDQSEVEATKAAKALKLPVFVITTSQLNPKTRDVYLGWVEGWDDARGVFLITFSDDIQPPLIIEMPEDEPFELMAKKDTSKKKQVKARPGQQRFSFRVFKRYGAKCAVCEISAHQVLEAAHLVPDEKGGSNDPRNGLVLCALHHRAFDAELFAIEPCSLSIKFKDSGPDADALKVDYLTLNHLQKKPHQDALAWRWNTWIQG